MERKSQPVYSGLGHLGFEDSGFEDSGQKYSGLGNSANDSQAWFNKDLVEQLPKINFFRFCQWLEAHTNTQLGKGLTPKADPVRFRPHAGMGFPASEMKTVSLDEYLPNRPPTLITTFLGLYGVDSPLPTRYIDDIAQNREGIEAVKEFLDIFNHRITAHYYRIWKKYNYPATFEHGGVDATSQYLLGLIGLGIKGSAERLGTPLSRYLALLGPMRLPTRTAEGLHALVKLLAPNTQASIQAHSPVRVILETPSKLSKGSAVQLAYRAVLGKTARDCNSELVLQLFTKNRQEAKGWLPDSQLYQDFLLLLRGYLGYRCTVRLKLTIPKSILPSAQLSKHAKQTIQLGRTAILGWKGLQEENNLINNLLEYSIQPKDSETVTLTLGRYVALT